MKKAEKVAAMTLCVASVVLVGELVYFFLIRPPAPIGVQVPNEVPRWAEVVAVISPTCVYCEQSVVSWNEIVAAGVRVAGVTRANNAAATMFAERTGARFPIVSLTDATWLDRAGVRLVPQTFVLDSNRKIVFAQPGALRETAVILRKATGVQRASALGRAPGTGVTLTPQPPGGEVMTRALVFRYGLYALTFVTLIGVIATPMAAQAFFDCCTFEGCIEKDGKACTYAPDFEPCGPTRPDHCCPGHAGCEET